MRIVATTAALLALALALAACGDDEPETTTTTTTETETTTTTVTEKRDRDRDRGGDGGPSGGTGPGSGGDCGDVGFRPNSDAGAFDIHAEGVDCETARRVAKAADGERGGDYSARGFACTGVREEGPLPTTEYTCAGGDDEAAGEITFSVS